MADEAVRRRVVVHGVVQGVFFRAATVEVASRLGLSGWVRNLPDGSVEAVLEGPSSSVEEAVGWLGHGPDRAIVDSLEVFEEEPEGLASFRVRY